MIECPPHLIGLLIGRGGSTIKRIKVRVGYPNIGCGHSDRAQYNIALSTAVRVAFDVAYYKDDAEGLLKILCHTPFVIY